MVWNHLPNQDLHEKGTSLFGHVFQSLLLLPNPVSPAFLIRAVPPYCDGDQYTKIGKGCIMHKPSSYEWN